VNAAENNPKVLPDRGEIERFYREMLRFAPKEGQVFLAQVPDKDNGRREVGQVVNLAQGLDTVVDAAFGAARVAAARGDTALTPPMSVFRSGARTRSEDEVLAGLNVMVDADHDEALDKLPDLEAVLGPPRLKVASGGTTKQGRDKLHVYWLLETPATDKAAQAKLRRARQLACAIINGDASAAPLSHCFRLPGSVHSKGAPRPCRTLEIAQGDVGIINDLDAALERLEAAAPPAARALPTVGDPGQRSDQRSFHELVDTILAGLDGTVNAAMATLVFRMAKGGTPAEEIQEFVEGLLARSEIDADRHAMRLAQLEPMISRATRKLEAQAERERRTLEEAFAEYLPDPEAVAAAEAAGEHAESETPGDEEPVGAENAQTEKPPLPYQQGMSFLQAPPRAMLMKRLLGLGDLSIWYGAPKSGKSFLVTDATLAVASELETWFDYRVKHPGLVIYCVLEGSGGFANRLNAWRTKHGRDIPDNFVWVTVRLSFLSDPTKKAAADDVKKLLALVRHIEATQGRTCRMVVVDTCARAMDGADENSTQDMTKFVNQCALLQDLPSKPHVAVVHHENAGGTKPRGSTALLGAGDVFIRIQKLEKGRVWTVIWGKDVEEGRKHGFALETVSLGFDEDMDVIESCAVVEAPLPPDTEEGPGGKKAKRKKREEAFEAKPPRRPRGQNQQLVLNALRAALFDTPDARPEGIDAPPGAAVVTRDTWWAAARDALPHEDEKKARDAFRDAVEGLVGTGFVGHHKRKVFWELGQPE
jgi:hypothetical protein